MRQLLVLSFTRRERKQTSYYRKQYSCYTDLIKQAWWYCVGADYDYTTSTSSYRPFMVLLYSKCY